MTYDSIPAPPPLRSDLFPARLAPLLALTTLLAGCRSPSGQVEKADQTAYATITAGQELTLGSAEPFTVRAPAEALRRRLLEEQQLEFRDPASLSSRKVDFIRHWPEGILGTAEDGPPPAPVETSGTNTVVITLVDALQVAARNSRPYQDRKESMFREALNLDLRRYDFATQWASGADVEWNRDETGEEDRDSLSADADLRATRMLANGALLSTGFTINFLELLTESAGSTMGVTADASVTIPLLRGAGRHIAREPLTQAERDLLYAVNEYERFKREFVVQTANQYLQVLRRLDGVRNAEENYARLRESVTRTQAMAEEERLSGIEVDQARQDELRARSGWISALQGFTSALDQFKISLGLPPEAAIALDPDELTRVLQVDTMPNLEELEVPAHGEGPVDEPWLDAKTSLDIALVNRLDLKVAAGRVEDAQRKVVVAADRLRPELTIGGSVAWDASDTSSNLDETINDLLSGKGGLYSALLSVDPALDRTVERNALRNTVLAFETTVRDYQQVEDGIKLDIREGIRSLRAAREDIGIQRNAVTLADRRVESTQLFLNLERAQVRDLLDAQSDLLDARNAYTAAQVDYRIAFLALQRDLGLLEVDEDGLWTEQHYQSLMDH